MTTQKTSAGAPGRAATSSGSGARPQRRRHRMRRREDLVLILFALPALAVYTYFLVMPALTSVQYSFTNWNGISADFDWVGLDNYRRALTGDTLFLNSLTNNLKFWLVVLTLQTAAGLLLAVLLFRNVRGSSLLRGVFFFPTILSSISVAYIWKFIYDPNYGLGNRVLGLFGTSSGFLGEADTAIYWVALSQVWFHAGQMMTIFIAGLQSVPRELLEAADVDGAGPWRKFWSITWPQIAPATSIVMAYTTIQSFKAFDLILGMGGNPPRRSLDIMSTRIYTTFANSEFGYAAAEAVLFVLVIVVLSVIVRRTVALTQPGS